MNNYQTQLIHAQINLLWHIREVHINDLTVNQIAWIDDDITYIDVKYLNESNDSTQADEYRLQEPINIRFLDALHILTTRINNTVEYLVDITDPDQPEI
jgi:hypothetical protein